MAEPKKKLSKTRTHRRRAGYRVRLTAQTICANCKETVTPHTICPYCGYYRGKKVKSDPNTKRLIVEETETKN